MKVTGDNITDEQIRELRLETFDRYQRGEEFPGPDKRATVRELLQIQSAALNPAGGVIGPDGYHARRLTQQEARARCAEMLEARRDGAA